MQVVVHEAKVVLPAVRAQDAPRRVVGDEELEVRHHGRVDAQAPRMLHTRGGREALQEILLGRVLAAAAEGPRPPAKRIKIEAAKA